MPSPSLSSLAPPLPSSPSSPSARWFRVSFSFLRVLQKGGEHLLTEPKRKHSFTAHNFLQSDQQNAKGIILNPCQGSSDSNLSWWMLESMHFSKAPCQTSDRRSQSRRTVWRTTKSFGPFGHMTWRSLPRNLGSLSPCNWKNPPVPKVQGVSLRAISNLWYSFSWGEPFIALESPSWNFLKSDFSANLVQLEPNMWQDVPNMGHNGLNIRRTYAKMWLTWGPMGEHPTCHVMYLNMSPNRPNIGPTDPEMCPTSPEIGPTYDKMCATWWPTVAKFLNMSHPQRQAHQTAHSFHTDFGCKWAPFVESSMRPTCGEDRPGVAQWEPDMRGHVPNMSST